MSQELKTELCYNRGCGEKYDPSSNNKDSCRHHPGAPFFHDAYKGWSCCNKKCTDFTEFLNIKGCTVSFHSNIKPPEPEKAPVNEELLNESLPKPKPIVPSKLKRPNYDSPITIMKPVITSSVKLEAAPALESTKTAVSTEVVVGTSCKNKGCTGAYQGPGSDLETCIHHPGVPVFHEGLKFWSCCKKRTSDFNEFLNQVGCERGKHLWISDSKTTDMNCRWDWHQTGTHVMVTIYGKNYCPTNSIIKLNPVRLSIKLIFPQESNAEFNFDIELRGIINVEESQVKMYGTKVEVNLKKAEPGRWNKLDIPRDLNKPQIQEETPIIEEITPDMEAVDLSAL